MIAFGSNRAARSRIDGGVHVCGHLCASAIMAAVPLPGAASSAVAPGAAIPTTQCESNTTAQQWWVDLSLPPLARVPASTRKAHLQAIQQQQAQITEVLTGQSVAVCASVTHLRNALAVQASAAQAAQLRSITGVRAVSAVSLRNRTQDAAPTKPQEQQRE